MRFILVTSIVLLLSGCANCDWSKLYSIPNESKLSFQECQSQGKIKIRDLELTPNIAFEIVHPNYPEGNTIWSVHSPDNKLAVVYIENSQNQRNAWLINLIENEVELFIDQSKPRGRHFKAEFSGNDNLIITQAGMGYSVKHYYQKHSDGWLMVEQKA